MAALAFYTKFGEGMPRLEARWGCDRASNSICGDDKTPSRFCVNALATSARPYLITLLQTGVLHMCCISLTPTNLLSPPVRSNTLLLRAQNNDSIRFVGTTCSSFHFPQTFCSLFIILQQIEGWNSPYFLYLHWVQCHWCSGEIQFSLVAACCGARQGCFHSWNPKASVNGSVFTFR